MPDYIVSFEFNFAKPGRAKSSIVGGSGNGTIDITTDMPEAEMKTDPTLIEFITNDVQLNPRLRKKGAIISLEIKTITKVK